MITEAIHVTNIGQEYTKNRRVQEDKCAIHDLRNAPVTTHQ